MRSRRSLRPRRPACNSPMATTGTLSNPMRRRAAAPRLPAVLLGSALFASCASVAHYEPIDDAVSRGDYGAGYAMIQEAKDSAYPPRNRILYALDAGMLAHYAGEWNAAETHLRDAELGIEAAFTKSVTLEASTYLVNDNTQEYPGEDYEDIYLNVFNALNYYHEGSVVDALVEIRRIDNKLKFLSTKYGTMITNAQKAVMDKSGEIPYDPSAMTSNFSNSALAQYLGMLFYRAEGKSDDARINRDQVKLAFANQPAMYPFALPASLDDELSIPAGKARLNVMSFNGPSPAKIENATRLQFSDMHWIKFALPAMQSRPSRIAKTEVAIDGGETFVLEQIEDMGAVAEETFKLRSGLIYLKSVLRSIAKTTASVALDKQSNDAGSAEGAILLGVLSLGTQIYAEASEQADLRMARYFPARAVVGGINLEPGTYSFTVNYYDASGMAVDRRRFENVEVRPNRLNLTEAVCIQ